jgi:hypothetical protein
MSSAQPCTKAQIQQYTAFYKKNVVTYGLFVHHSNLKDLSCFYQVFTVDGSYRTVMWYDLSPLELEHTQNLYLSMKSSNDPFDFEDNLEIPLLKDSLNETYLKEQKGELQFNDRAVGFMTPFVNHAAETFLVSKKYEYFETLYLMHMINLDKLMNIMIADFFAIWVAKENPYLMLHWEKEMIDTCLGLYQGISTKLNLEFQEALDTKIAQKTYNDVVKNVVYVSTEYAKILNILETYESDKTPMYGRNNIGAALNKQFNMIQLSDLVNFMKDLEVTVDKKKNLEFEVPLVGDNEAKQFKNLLGYMKNIPAYVIQFFLLEKFELLDMKRPVVKGTNLLNMFAKTPQDNCGLTANKKQEFLQAALFEKALNQEIITSGLDSIYVRCELTVDGNLETYKMILKPDGKAECTLVVNQLDKGHNTFQVEVMLDTYPTYGDDISCMRYTRSVVLSNFYFLI